MKSEGIGTGRIEYQDVEAASCCKGSSNSMQQSIDGFYETGIDERDGCLGLLCIMTQSKYSPDATQIPDTRFILGERQFSCPRPRRLFCTIDRLLNSE